MRFIQTIFAASLLTLLSGCGGAASSLITALTPSYPAMTGNWTLAGTSQLTSANIGGTWLAGGSLTNTKGAVSGTLHILNSPCFLLTLDIPVTGTVSAGDVTSNISLVSASLSGQVITVAGTVVTAGSTLALNATYTVAGGCAGGDKGTLVGTLVPPITNPYTGAFVAAGSAVSLPVTMVLTQGAADSHGYFAVTGTATFTGSSCYSTGTVNGGVLVGNVIGLLFTTDKGGQVDFSGTVTPGTGAIPGIYVVSSGPCAGDHGSVTLTHP